MPIPAADEPPVDTDTPFVEEPSGDSQPPYGNPLTFSERRYRRLFETAHDGILILDALDGRIVDANPFMSELLGYSHTEFIGKELFEIGLFRDETASRTAMRVLQRDGYIRYEDMPLETQDGQKREVEFVSNVYRENGIVVIQCNIRDITERKAHEAALRDAHIQLEAAYLRERTITKVLQSPLFLEIAGDAFPNLQVATIYAPALNEAEVGGDFFDIFPLPGGQVAIAIGDASGKGLSAAVRTLQVKDVLRAFTREARSRPEEIVARLNDFVCDTKEFDTQSGESFLCLALAVLDPLTGIGTMVTAGCEPPLLVRRRENLPPGEPSFTLIDRFGELPLGIVRGHRYRPIPLVLQPGDTLVLVTDGITEARRGNDFFGYAGLIPLLEDALAQSGDLRACGEAVLSQARAFAEGTLRDDACLVLVRRV